jgi:hypothetical protein
MIERDEVDVVVIHDVDRAYLLEVMEASTQDVGLRLPFIFSNFLRLCGSVR